MMMYAMRLRKPQKPSDINTPPDSTSAYWGIYPLNSRERHEIDVTKRSRRMFISILIPVCCRKILAARVSATPGLISGNSGQIRAPKAVDTKPRSPGPIQVP